MDQCLLPSAVPTAPPSLVTSSAATRAHRDFERECVELFTEVVQVFGVPKSVGQIYGSLFSSPEPLSFSDIVERLEISKGSASHGLQLLRSLGAINVAENSTRASGADASRRDYYEPELSLRKLMSGVLQERVTPLAAIGTERLMRLRALAEGNDFHLDRAKQLETWRRRLRTVLPVLSALLGPKSKK